jgi:RND family efflux transporter MFP subunit
MKKIVIGIILLSCAGAGFWYFNPAKAHKVETITLKDMPAVQAVYASGTVEATRTISIAPKMSARLMTLLVDEGAVVEAGQVLAQMEDTDVDSGLKELEAKMDLAQKDLARAEKLSKSGAISKEALDSARSAYRSAQAATDRAKAELGFLKLVAPEAGTIIRRDGEIGELITTGTPVFWVSGGNDLRIETEVDEEDIRLVKNGQKVLISADAFPEKIFNGSVQSITPMGDAVARSYRVRVGIDGDTDLMIGMTAEANIITSEKENASMIPSTAVKGRAVIVIKDGKAVRTAVETGIQTQDSTEITSGVDKGAVIAKSYSEELLKKDRLIPIPAKMDAPTRP